LKEFKLYNPAKRKYWLGSGSSPKYLVGALCADSYAVACLSWMAWVPVAGIGENGLMDEVR
jgi:hypothetical protein